MRVTIAEGAELVGKHERTIYRWLEQGYLAVGHDGRLSEDELLLVERMTRQAMKRAARKPRGARPKNPFADLT